MDSQGAPLPNVAAVQVPAQTVYIAYDVETRAVLADLANRIGQMYGELHAQTEILQRMEERQRVTNPVVTLPDAEYQEFSQAAADLLARRAEAGLPNMSDIWGAVASAESETDPSTLSPVSPRQGTENAATEANATPSAIPTQEEYDALANRWYFADPPRDLTIMIRGAEPAGDGAPEDEVTADRPANADEKRIIQYFNRKAPGQSRGGRSRPTRRT